MIKYYLFSTFLIGAFFISKAQIQFEPGYFITNENITKNGLIRNVDWASNPESILYKASDSAEIEKIGIEEMSEFGIFDKSKFVKRDIRVNLSSQSITTMKDEVDTSTITQQVLLEVLMEGSASLYRYRTAEVRLFFFDSPDIPTTQLILQQKKVDERIIERKKFRSQLASYVRCEELPQSYLTNVEYVERDLIRYFKHYYECHDKEYSNWFERKGKQRMHLQLNGGVGLSKLKIANAGYFRSVEYTNLKTYHLSAQLEFELPFHNRKWAVLIEPTFAHLEGYEDMSYNQDGSYVSDFGLNIADLLLGGKFYFMKRFFIDFGGLMAFYPSSSVNFRDKYGHKNISLKPYSSFSLTGGLGTFIRPFSLELRAHGNRDMLSARYPYWSSKFTRLELKLGYRIK